MRLVWGWILFGIAALAIMAGGILFPIFLGAACVMGGNEFISMTRAKGFNPSPRIIRGMIIAFFAVAALPVMPGLSIEPGWPLEHYPFLLTIGICLSFFRLLLRHEKPPATIADIATTILGFIYVGFLPSHIVLLRNLMPPGMAPIANPLQQPGLAYVWVCLFIVWASDIFAYYAGKAWGKHLLYPQISPKKTIEGAVGGFVAAVLFAVLVVYTADHFFFPSHPFRFKLWQAPLMGAAVSVAAQLGDLCESLLKRDAGIKDSSTFIPGHGGFLDRGDSMLFGGPISYYWIWMVVLGHF
ncbi:MAG TPA: phosphatidate cytidylyltransferase [Candidatus Obscuribacterales bacterium]